MNRLDFRALGGVVVRSDDRALPVGGVLQMSLLSVLLLHANRTASVDRIADMLWNGAPPKSARPGIQGRISRLRRLLGDPDRLTCRPPGYLLRIDNGEFDVDEFVRLADQGARGLRAGELTRAREALDAAMTLWAGEPFAGASVEACREAAVQLETRRLLAVEDRFEAALRLGQHDEVLGDLTALAGADPLVMDRLGRGGEQHRPAGVAEPLAEVGLVRVDEEGRVEEAHLLRRLAPDHQSARLRPADRPCRVAAALDHQRPLSADRHAALRRLANEVSGRDGPVSPSSSACDRRRHAGARLVLAGRALRVPVASASGGHSRSTKVDPRRL